jgi:hypothetical protein
MRVPLPESRAALVIVDIGIEKGKAISAGLEFDAGKPGRRARRLARLVYA